MSHALQVTRELQQVAAGTTTSKTGSLTAGTSLSGADVAEHVEAGSLTPKVSLSGADVAEHVETGALIVGSQLSGADSTTRVKSGSLLVGTLLSGMHPATYAKAGSLLAGTQLSGADVATHVETGSLTVGVVLSGAKVVTGSATPPVLAITTPSIYDRGVQSMSGLVKLVLGTYRFSSSYATGGETFQLPPLAQNVIIVLFQSYFGYSFSLESGKVKAYTGAGAEVAAATNLSVLGDVEFAAITY